MKRLMLMLLVWLILVLPCAASTLVRPASVSTGSVSTSGTATVNTTGNSLQGDLLFMACGDADAANAITPSAGGWTAVTPRTAAGHWAGIWTRTVSGSEPVSYTATGTSSDHIGCTLWSELSTDGTTPVLEANNGSTTGTLAAVTTATANDLITFVTVGSFGFDASPPIGQFMAGSPTFLGINAGEVGQTATGASITPTINYSGGFTGATFSLAVKSNTTTAALFKGVGPEQFNSTPVSGTNPTAPTNAVAGDALIASIIEYTTTGIAITPQQTNSPIVASASPNAATISIPAGITAGMVLVSCAFAGGTPTLPPNGGTNNWVSDCNDATFFGVRCGHKVLQVADSSTTATWGGAGINNNWAILQNAGTIALDQATCSSHSAATTFTPTSVTTTAANEYALSWDNVGNGAAVSTAPPIKITNSPQQNCASSFFFQAAAGAVPSQTFSSSTNNTHEGAQLSFTNVLQPIFWTLIGTVVDPTGLVQLNLYSLPGSSSSYAGIAYLFNFASNPATADAVIAAFSNLDTTTPVDANLCTSLTTAGMNNPMAPSMTPTSADELLFYGAAPSVGFGTTILTNGGLGNRIGLGYGPLSGAAASSAGGGTNTVPFVTLKCGLKAATTPTRTTAHALVNFEALEVFTSTLPLGTGGNFELMLN